MQIREATKADRADVLDLRCALWPHHTRTELADELARLVRASDYAFLVADDGALQGYVEVSLRRDCNGCTTSPVGYLEAWYVDPSRRGKGLGRTLVTAAEAWARARGAVEMGSDARTDNTASRAAHAALGYRECRELVHFIKRIDLGGGEGDSR